MKKLTKRQQQAIKTKNKILETALPMIRENGFANVSVDDICLAAGVAKGTFYHYFDSKEKIFGETGVMMDDLEISNLLSNEQFSSLDKIFYIVESYMELAINQGIDITRHIMKAFLEGADIFNEKTIGRKILEDVINEGIARK